jgi:hypothetical protein
MSAVPSTRERKGSSSHELGIDFRVCGRCVPAQHPEGPEHLPWVFSPLRDISTADSSNESEVPNPHLSSVLSVSHTLDGLLPAEPCGLISSRSHVWGSPYKGFPCCQAATPRRRCMPSWRFLDSLLLSAEASSTSANRPASKALIRATIRDHQQSS